MVARGDRYCKGFFAGSDAVTAMSVSSLVSKVEQGFEESQNQRDARVEQLWTKLDPDEKGELDLKGLRTGLKRIDHREHPSKQREFAFCDVITLADTVDSHAKCGRYAEADIERGRHQPRRENSV